MTNQVSRIIGLTGGIASGKSCIRKMFEDLNVPCVDIDILSRAIHQDPMHPACADLRHVFPQQMTKEGCLQRGSLRHYFAHFPESNQILKNLLKPYVLQELLAWTSRQSSAYVVWESALLVQENLLENFAANQPRTLWVKTSYENQFARLSLRYPDWSHHELERLMSMQFSFQQVGECVDDIIENNADLNLLKHQVEQLHQIYLNSGANK
jgi:dephospho-CoA kinase